MSDNLHLPTAPQVFPDLVSIYTAFKERICDPSSVLHPGCAYDASPSAVFRNVTYVDPDEDAMRVMRNAGLKAFPMKVQEYVPTERHDLLILLNPNIPTVDASQHLAVGGLVLANNYNQNATQMAKLPGQFRLEAALDESNGIVTFARDFEGFFVEMRSGEELRRVRPELFENISGELEMFKLNDLTDGTASIDEYLHGLYVELHGHLPYRRGADRYVFRKIA